MISGAASDGVAVLRQCYAHVELSVKVSRIKPYCFVEVRQGILNTSCCDERVRQVIVRERVVRAQREDQLVQVLRLARKIEIRSQLDRLPRAGEVVMDGGRGRRRVARSNQRRAAG